MKMNLRFNFTSMNIEMTKKFLTFSQGSSLNVKEAKQETFNHICQEINYITEFQPVFK